jgi:rhamnosyltransferase
MECWDIIKVNPPERKIKKITGPLSRQRMRALISFQDISSCIKKEVWEKIRFNESLIMSEDQDWARRVLQAGYSILYEPESLVYHSHGYKPKEIFKRSFDEAWSLSQVLGWPLFPNFFKEFIIFLYHCGHDFYSILTSKDKKMAWLIKAPAFRFMRRTGLFLGSYYPYIPPRLKRSFSYYLARQRE